ncbi:MAG: YajG family lipoprotein, partial [Gammaproteobacteria bacterium]
MRRLPFATVLLLLVAVAGCATSSQILPVTPRPAVSAGAERGAGRTLAAELIDARPDNVVGLRDPAAPDTAITTPPEMLARIRQAIEDGFRRQGFAIVPVGEPADVVLEVRLTELGYQRDASGALKDLRTGATFE